MTTTAYILDDEMHAREVLQDKLESHCPNVSIVGSSPDPIHALGEVKRLKPELLFLDIAMPGMNGFQFLENLNSFQGEVIFVTAFNEYAIDAFKVCALGYLLKPVNTEELIHTVKAFLEKKNKADINSNSRIEELMNLRKNDTIRIAIPTQEGYAFSNIEDIIRCEASEKCTYIFTKDRKLLSTKNIGYYIDILNKYDFFPTHKSHLINMNNVSSYDRDGLVILSNGDEVPVSRRRKSEFIAQFV